MKTLRIDNLDILVTISSNGEIKFWDCLYLIQQVAQINETKQLGTSIQPIYDIQTKERLTAFTVNILSQNSGEEQNSDQAEDNDSEQIDPEQDDQPDKQKQQLKQPQQQKKGEKKEQVLQS